MVYVALLRGVNVGGSGRIDMKELKAVFESAGMTSVKTYINSGNVVFATDASDDVRIAEKLERAIDGELGATVRVLVRSTDQIRSVAQALPADWANDDTTKCDVFFLWHNVDRPSIIEQLDFDPQIDDVRYTPGALIRCVDRKNASKSKLTRLVGTSLYKEMTIRNCNTTRKILLLMDEIDSAHR
jgi:uncharacterized protein (DUF1697 family)